jgi:septum formation protein
MLVLASASPRRQELLRTAGIPFTVQPADIDETPRENESAKDCAERLARDKARAVGETRPGEWVLGADTVVVVEGKILGKPSDTEDAARMLRLLSGREHEVITGVCLFPPNENRVGWATRPHNENRASTELRAGSGWYARREMTSAAETTLVTMVEFSDEEIREYVATGEPMDKAGAYAIQGIASRWIPRIEGDYSNVVGLPVALVWRMLRTMGQTGFADGSTIR